MKLRHLQATLLSEGRMTHAERQTGSGKRQRIDAEPHRREPHMLIVKALDGRSKRPQIGQLPAAPIKTLHRVARFI